MLNLEKSGLLATQQGGAASSNYAVLRKRLHLTQDDVNEQTPTDITYVHSVYAPLSIRLVQNCASQGWWAVRDLLDLLPGPSFEEVQQIPGHLRRNRNISGDDGLKRTLVLFVGGCTFAEISALRFLSQHEDASTEYLVATTSVITGSKLIESLMTPLNDPLGF